MHLNLEEIILDNKRGRWKLAMKNLMTSAKDIFYQTTKVYILLCK